MSIKVSIHNAGSGTNEGLAALIRMTPGLLLGSVGVSGGTHGLPPGYPHVIVFEPDHSDVTPYKLVGRIRTHHPNARFLVLERQFSQGSIQRAVAAGAHGLLSMQVSHYTLLEAIFQIAAGGVFFDPLALGLLVESLHQEPSLLLAQMDLTHREFDVMDGYRRGNRGKEVADWLQLSPFTVQTHVRNIYSKLDARSMAHAIALCHPLGRLSIRWLDGVASESGAEKSP
jgi:DNA-binding NarL/FixJ family response regulator